MSVHVLTCVVRILFAKVRLVVVTGVGAGNGVEVVPPIYNKKIITDTILPASYKCSFGALYECLELLLISNYKDRNNNKYD